MSREAFQHRHYKAVAHVMAQIEPMKRLDPAWREIVDGLIVLFKNDNPRFVVRRFEMACCGAPITKKDKVS